jgi:hypothetical protein
MPIPTPEPGLVISYAYLWHHEHEAGREEGRKDRPFYRSRMLLPPTPLAPSKFLLRSNIISDLMTGVRGSLSQRATNSIGPAMIFGKSAAAIAMTMASYHRDSSIR